MYRYTVTDYLDWERCIPDPPERPSDDDLAADEREWVQRDPAHRSTGLVGPDDFLPAGYKPDHPF